MCKNYSQYTQDIFALIYSEGIIKKNYIEVGGYDPILHSNSYMLEKCGWEGICIEPDPNKIKLFHGIRNAKLLNYAISDSKGELEYIEAGSLSSLRSTITKEHFERIKKAGNYTVQTVQVDLFDIVDEHINGFDITYVSIDVEGHELNVLASIDFQKYEILLLTVETGVNNEEAIEKYLFNCGYHTLFHYHGDKFFIQNNYYKKFNTWSKLTKLVRMKIYFLFNDICLIFNRIRLLKQKFFK